MEWLYVLFVITAQGDTLRHTILNTEPKANMEACLAYARDRIPSLAAIQDHANDRSAEVKIRYHIVGTCMQVFTP